MNAEVNIDNLIDYKTEYSRVIKKAHITGDQMTGCCRSMKTEAPVFLSI